MSDPQFVCDLANTPEPFPHFWEHTVGSCHATMALRADYQKQLARCHEELGFKHVRFHGLLGDDMGTLMMEMDQLVYSFFNADQIWDFLLSIGMKPFVELSFMPSTLSSGSDIVFHYKGNVTPPRDYAAWETLIQKLVQHWVDRYGVEEVKEWFFEVWNEPNLSDFWKGTQADYFRLYQYSARAIKNVNPELKVGGPATANNAWIAEFLDFCEKNNVPVDFVSTHHYPTDAFGKPGDDTEAQLAASRRSILREQAQVAREQARTKPLYYTEWSTSSNPFDEFHDQSYAAAYIVKAVMENHGLVQGYSHWTFSDIFEENYFSSTPFHGGFGLVNIYGIPKPAYRAYELLHHMGDQILRVTGQHPTVDAWVTRRKGQIKVLLSNSALPRHPIKTEIAKIELKNDSFESAYLEQIDEENSNAHTAWVAMGRPSSLRPCDVENLEAVSALKRRPFPIKKVDDSVILEVALPPQSCVCITLETNA